MKSWASYLPVVGDKKALFGEQMNGITVLLRTKYKNYMQATVVKLVNNVSHCPPPLLFLLFYREAFDNYGFDLFQNSDHNSITYHIKGKDNICLDERR